ncbi:type I-C CRISPR-associated protein Cas7/Csd2 [Caniella muris]|uniref:type I-C CRISPR-associated protein Cas7/Csd2 n=1 Tax=Caniella muris TaxID=2941502 RepID=UPI00203F3CB4|nr:type I-C CRISPR-associated protein Cas7/Csd2 [Caniella muris]
MAKVTETKYLDHRVDGVCYFDISMGNPNGDPDNDDMPRTVPTTNQGFVTDVAIKRKLRDYVATTREGEPGLDIYISGGRTLNSRDIDPLRKLYGFEGDDEDFDAVRRFVDSLGEKKKGAGKALTDCMCRTYFDVRTFGAVMTAYSKASLGNLSVRGPVQITNAVSVDPVVPMQVTVTRCAVATEKERENQGDQTMGSKWVVPYGLYRFDFHISSYAAEKTGFSEDDLALLLEALTYWPELTSSASRQTLAVRRLVVFEHGGRLGALPQAQTVAKVSARKLPDVEVASSFSDYEVVLPEPGELPEGLTMRELV